jgi:CzcA family heavy metal efflux pump
MNWTVWVQSHRRSILFFLTVLALGGAASSLKLPVALFPRVSFPRVVVDLEAGDRPAELMAVEVTRRVEETVRSVPGVVSIRSTTSRGSAGISINFEWGQDMVAALLQVESAIGRVLPDLPPGTSFNVRRMDPTVFPVLAYSITSDTQPSTKLRDLALYQLRPLLSTVKGVAKVDVLGGAREEYRVSVDPARLYSYGLSFAEVANALSAANVITAVGRLEDHYKLYLAVSDTRFHSVSEIRNTVLRSGEHGIVLVEDIAQVSKATALRWTRVTADGHEAVIFQVYQQLGGNTVEINKELKEKLAEFHNRLPEGIKIANWYDQSQLILSSAHSVRDAILIGVILAGLILLLFLRNLKIMLIVVIAVPSVLAVTVFLLYVLHMSFNIMTLGGMAAAVGLIIDDTIVMVEEIVRRLKEGESEHRSNVLRVAFKFTRPLSGSSASTIIIFFPLAFLSGVTGAFFKALSLTVAGSLIISFFVAWLVEPLIASHLLKPGDYLENGRLTTGIHRGYEAIMQRLLRHPWLVLLLVIPLIFFGWFSYKKTGSGFMPKMDEGGFILDYWAPPGTSLTETDRLLSQVEGILQATRAVETYSRRTGLQLGGGVTEVNEGDFFVRLKPFPRPPIEDVMDRVRTEVERSVPGLHIEMAQLMEDLIGDLTAVPQPIEIKLYSDDGELLMKLGPKVAEAIGKIPGVVDVKSGVVLAGDALQITVDRVKASLEGVDPESVTKMVQDFLQGVVTAKVEEDPKMVGVRLWVPRNYRATEPDVKKMQLQAPDGRLFPLQRIATVSAITGQPQIMRDDLKRMIATTGRISGRDMGSVIRDVKAVLDRSNFLPKEVYYTLGGLYAQQQIAFAGLILVFAAAVMLVFLLLLVLYESFRVALAILAMPLLAMSVVFVGLWITGTEINISSMMGMTMIVGIVTEVAIFYMSEYYELAAEEKEQGQLVTAGKNRMRPIAMTTFAAILALLPLALNIGQGSAMQQPLAIAIISGLCVQLPLVLVVLPVLLVIFRGEKGRRDTI